ncbi:MAG: EAL domain-containing protein [Burkholderiales bacterium]
MTTAPSAPTPTRPMPWAARVTRALMPDYNRKATVYWWVAVAVGLAVVIHAGVVVGSLPLAAVTQIAVGIAIAMTAGFFPVRIPRSTNSFAAGEIFIFLLLMMHGPEAASLAAAGEALVGSWRTSKRWTSRIASPAMAAIAMAIAGGLLQAALARLAEAGWTNAGLLIIGAMTCALIYFLANTLLVTTAPRLKRDEPFRATILFGLFGWVGLAYTGSAAIAALLHLTLRQSGIGVLMAVVPIIAMMLATLHYFFRQQETDAAARRTATAAAEREADAARREAEATARHVQQLEASERRFHSAFTHASIGMALLSFEGVMLQANTAMHELLGMGESELAERGIEDFICCDDLGRMNEQLRLLKTRQLEAVTIELQCRGLGGRLVWIAAHCSFFSEPGSGEPCLILQAHDITARRNAEAGLHHLAFHDSLTGLPNRRRFQEHLGEAVCRAQLDPADSFAVMFIDFDRFKLINDSLGHSAGDEFLTQVSRSLQEHLRPGDVVARLGGDEFAILVRRPESTQAVVALAERLLQAMRRPMLVAGTELITSASIGITLSSIGYTAPDEVLRDADIAMYKAKATGKARYALFDIGLHTEITRRVRLEGELRRALDGGQLNVAYQPLFNLGTGAVAGFEALARWNHAEFGAVEPNVFIPIAEETGLILQLTDFMLHRACHELARWQQSNPAFADLTMQVNISGKDIASPAFLARVTHALVEARVQPQQLVLELTENTLMERIDGARARLTELRNLGVGLSVDDFGTGYSSLAHLSSLPIDSLKVDRSFVRDMRFDTKESTVVRAIIHLGNSLGKAVIAEGIETRLQFSQLHEMGCEFGQGFHLSRPLDRDAVDALLVSAVARSAIDPINDPIGNTRIVQRSAFH